MKTLNINEQRAHRRLAIRLPLEYHRLDSARRTPSQCLTANVSTGGVYFETASDAFRLGDLLQFEIGVPSNDHRFPQHGKITSKGQIIRVDPLPQAAGPNPIPRFGIAAQFQDSFKMTF